MSDSLLETLCKAEVAKAATNEQTAALTATTSTAAIDLLGTDEGVWLVSITADQACSLRFGIATVGAAVVTDVERIVANTARRFICDASTRYTRVFPAVNGTLSYNRTRLQ